MSRQATKFAADCVLTMWLCGCRQCPALLHRDLAKAASFRSSERLLEGPLRIWRSGTSLHLHMPNIMQQCTEIWVAQAWLGHGTIIWLICCFGWHWTRQSPDFAQLTCTHSWYQHSCCGKIADYIVVMIHVLGKPFNHGRLWLRVSSWSIA